jgi:phytoene desaturase
MQGKKVIIVGAGPGGLSAAMLLAHQGFDVTVFEKGKAVGGRNGPLKIDSYTFDTGPTFLMMKFILDEVFRLTGRNIADYLECKLLEPMYRLQFDDREVICSSNHETMQQEINQKFPGVNSRQVEHFISSEQRRFEKLMPALRRDYSSWASLFSRELWTALPYFGIYKSLFDILGRYFKPDKLKLSFTFQAKYLGMSPWECPGGFAIIPYIEHAFGIWHVMGGLFKICGAMAQVTAEEGGKIHTETAVASLHLEGKQVKGVVLEDGRVVHGDYVIVNADFAYAMQHLLKKDTLRRYTPQRLAAMQYSCSIFMLYLGLDKLYNLEHHNIYFARQYRKNVEDIFQRYTLSTDFSIYVQNASITDPDLAPPGHSAVYVLVPVPNNKSDINWEQEKPRLRKLALEALRQRAGMEDVEEHIVVEKIISPLEWEQDYNVYLGATFNLAHSIRQMLYFRPHNKFEELDGLYLVGGGTHPGSGLPTIYQSALISTALIMQECGLEMKSPVTWVTGQASALS